MLLDTYSNKVESLIHESGVDLEKIKRELNSFPKSIPPPVYKSLFIYPNQCGTLDPCL
ncbi:MAG: hypothetical protein ACFE9I_06045 [Candidatus Hermodarchaeota archaeon]